MRPHYFYGYYKGNSKVLIEVLIEGMDNKKSFLPRLLEKSKAMSGTERLVTKISGCIMSSGWYEHKRKCLFYTNHEQVSGTF